MTKTLYKAFATAAIALSLAGCESQADRDAKPAVVAQLVQNSADMCQRGPVNADKPLYAARLGSILSRVPTEELRTLQTHKITVCLDQREGAQKYGFFDRPITGVYYSAANNLGGTLAIWDQGSQTEDTFPRAGVRRDLTVKYLAEGIEVGLKLPPAGGRLYAAQFGKYNYTKWSTEADFSTSVVNKNPQLKTPPLVKATL